MADRGQATVVALESGSSRKPDELPRGSELTGSPDGKALVDDNSEEENTWGMVEVDAAPEKTNSDQMTVDSHSPPLLPGDLES